jgi:hypothetical protein
VVSKTTTGLSKHLKTKHQFELDKKLDPSRPKASESQIESKPSTSTSVASKLQMFAKPKPPTGAAPEISGLFPTTEEMDLDDDLLPNPVTEQLSIDVGVTNLEDECIASPESTDISTSDSEVLSPMSGHTSSVSPALYPKSTRKLLMNSMKKNQIDIK